MQITRIYSCDYNKLNCLIVLCDLTILQATEMFTEIKGQFIDGLKEQTWMDPGTRAQARLKVSGTKVIKQCSFQFMFLYMRSRYIAIANVPLMLQSRTCI